MKLLYSGLSSWLPSFTLEYLLEFERPITSFCYFGEHSLTGDIKIKEVTLPEQKSKYENYDDIHRTDIKPSKVP